MHRPRGVIRRTAIGLALLSLLASAACSSSGATGQKTSSNTDQNSSSPSSTASSGSASGTSRYRWSGTPDETKAAAAAAVDPAPPKLTKPAGKVIAFIPFNGQSTSSQRVQQGVADAVHALGYKLITCDPGSNAQQVPVCANSMVAQHPNLILSYFLEPAALGSALQSAASANIPWVDIGSPVSPDKNLIQYALPVKLSQDAIDKWIVANLKPSSGTMEVYGIAATATGTTGVQEKDMFDTAVKSAPQLKWVGDHDLDLSNLQQDTVSAVNQALTQYPHLGAIWTVCDLCVPIIAQTVKAAGRNVIVTGNFSTPQTVELIRSGQVAAVVDNPWEAWGWIALDRALTAWATNKPFASSGAGADYPLRFGEPYILTKENAGSGNEPSPVYGPDFATYFKTKWKAEFGSI